MVREIESPEAHIGASLRTRPGLGCPGFGIEADLIIHLLLLGIAEYIICFLYLLEPLFGGFVARIQIGVVLARKVPVRFSDFLRAGAAFHPECLIKVGHWCLLLVVYVGELGVYYVVVLFGFVGLGGFALGRRRAGGFVHGFR